MSATESQIRAWLNDPASGPSVYRRNWDQLCQALMWQVCNRFGNASRAYASANTARAASRINGTNPKDAPAGAFHYWEIGIYGHVALSLGGSRCLMGSRHVEQWARNVGVTTVEAYTRATGARYTGWSRTNGVNTIQVVTTSPGGGIVTPIPNIPSIPVPEEEDEDMAKNHGIYYTRARDKKMVTALVNLGSGFYSEWTSSHGGTYNNPIAVAFETGSFVEVTESHANALKADLALVRQGK